MGNDLSIWLLVRDASPIVQASCAAHVASVACRGPSSSSKGPRIAYSIRQADHFEQRRSGPGGRFVDL